MAHVQSSVDYIRTRNFVDGEYVATERSFENLSPVDGSVVSLVSEADEALVDRAVDAARAALAGPWGRFSAAERAFCLLRIADGIEKRFDEFLEAEIADTGKPRQQAESLDIPRGAANFRVFTDLVRSQGDELFETVTTDGIRAVNYSIRNHSG